MAVAVVSKQWQSKEEAAALDGIITLIFQYIDGDNIDTQGVRSVEGVIDLLKEYGLVKEVRTPIPDIPLQYFRHDIVDMDRWKDLTDYIRSHESAST